MVVFFTSLCLHFLGLAFVSSPHWLAHCWHKDGSPLSTQHGWLQVDPKLDVLEGLGGREGCFSNEKQRYSLNTLGFVVPLSCRVILIKVWQSLCELQLIDIPEFVFYYLTVMLLHIIQLAMSVFLYLCCWLWQHGDHFLFSCHEKLCLLFKDPPLSCVVSCLGCHNSVIS